MTLRYLLVPLVASAVTTALMPPLVRILQHVRSLDYPNERSSHSQPVLRGGGIAVLLGVIAGTRVPGQPLNATLLPLLAAILLFGSIGLGEDFFGIPPMKRLSLQLIAGTVVAASIAAVNVADWLYVPLIVLWLTTYTNAFNFMDGINGISAAQAVVAGLAYAYIGMWKQQDTLVVGGLALVGGALAFLPWNVPKARVFLGDVGSYGLGAAIASIAAMASYIGATPEAAIAPLAVYLADTGTTLLRRIWSREPWRLPHRTHTYQQLTDVGWTHSQVTVAFGALAICCSCLGAGSMGSGPLLRAIFDVVLVTALVAYLVLPCLLRGRRNRLSSRRNRDIAGNSPTGSGPSV